jgi:adenine-specific DNA-methyltransferase
LKNIEKYLDYLNNLEIPKDENYISINYWNRYFDKNNALLIWKIRKEIENLKISKQEKNILLSSLIYSVDKIANTCWHYAAFRKKLDKYSKIKLDLPEINLKNNWNNEIYSEDANELVRKIETDVLYIDPPYNSRQYFNSYHVLENLVKRDKVELEWITKQRKDRWKYKSDYCSLKARDIFADLIKNAKAKYIIVSYNNTWEKLDARSNSRIKEKELLEILWKKWEVRKYEKDYKYYTTGKNNDIKNHKEILYFCKVK